MERPHDKIEIPRRSPRIRADMGGRAITLDWYRSTLHIYRAPYGHMNHLQHRLSDEERLEHEKEGMMMRAFGNDKGNAQLLKLGFTATYASEPSDLVLQHYAMVEGQAIDSEIVALLGGEETA